MSNNKHFPQNQPTNMDDDTPIALLEQLVYMDNFLTDSPNDDQLERELAAFADDEFIFADEDKKDFNIYDQGSSDDPQQQLYQPQKQQHQQVQQQQKQQLQQQQQLSERYHKPKFEYHNTIPNTIHELLGKTKKPQVPLGAQSTLSAAGLSQPQIDALANLVAYHKPDVYSKSSPLSPFPQSTQGASPSQQAMSQKFQQNQLSNQNHNLGLQGTQGIGSLNALNLQGSQQRQQQEQSQAQQQPHQIQQQQQQQQQIAALLATTSGGGLGALGNLGLNNLFGSQPQQQQQPNNNLLVSLLAQTLANSVQPGQNLLADLVVALAHQSGNSLGVNSHSSNQTPTVQNIINQQNEFSTPARAGSSATTITAATSISSPLDSEKRKKIHKSTEESISNSNSTSPISSNSTEKMDPEEEKRQRVTAASARFRQKKKMKEQEMENNLQELQDLSRELQSRISQLEMENNLLKNLVTEKSMRRDEEEVERLRKRAKKEP